MSHTDDMRKLLNQISTVTSRKALNETITPKQALQMVNQDETNEAFTPDAAAAHVRRGEEETMQKKKALAKSLHDAFEAACIVAARNPQTVKIQEHEATDENNPACVTITIQTSLERDNDNLDVISVPGNAEKIVIPHSQWGEVTDILADMYKSAGWTHVEYPWRSKGPILHLYAPLKQ